ncbi:MAG: septum site-determining protein MinC [Clostridia bacterium]|nr:septum site-determining protein MinC [Clostridia bacterium]
MEKLVVKGRGEKIELCFSACENLSDALIQLQKKKSFFNNSEVKISYDGIKLGYNGEMEFEKELKKLFGDNITLEKKHRLSRKQIEYSLCENERILKVIHKSLRSGDVVESRGDLVIYGDVNPGATVKARGNITIIGVFRGTAHITGEGRVYAAYMNPCQIKIGKVCSYNKNTENVGSAVAIAENGEIILERL